jgi:hypothetical protein
MVTLYDFSKAVKKNTFLSDLVNNFTSIFSYKIQLEKHKASFNELDSLDQVAGT